MVSTASTTETHMTYEDFLVQAVSTGALAPGFTPDGDGMVSLTKPVPVKIDPNLPVHPYPFEHGEVYDARMFCTQKGKYPCRLFFGTPSKWWKVEDFTLA